MAKVVWSDQASDTLVEIAAYLVTRNDDTASRVGRDLFAAGESLCDFPHRGRPAGKSARELVSVPPCVIRYEVIGEIVLILSVRHGRQRPLL